MLLQLELAGKVVYLLIRIVLLLLYLQKSKSNRRGGRHVQTTNRVNFVRGDNGGETIRGQIARRVCANVTGGEVGDTTGCQYAGKVHFDVAGDDDDDTINGKIAMGRTSTKLLSPSLSLLLVSYACTHNTIYTFLWDKEVPLKPDRSHSILEQSNSVFLVLNWVRN